MSDDWPELGLPVELPEGSSSDDGDLAATLSAEQDQAGLDDAFWGSAEDADGTGDEADASAPGPADDREPPEMPATADPPPGEISLDLPEEPAPDTAQPVEVGSFPDGVVTAVDVTALTDAFAVPAPDLGAAMTRLGLEPPVEGWSAAVLLEELGLDAAATHGDIDALAARVSAGDDVLLSSDSGPLQLTAVDVGEGFVEVRDGATLRRLDLGVFENAWEQAAYAMVVAEPASSSQEVTLSSGPVTLLGLRWPT